MPVYSHDHEIKIDSTTRKLDLIRDDNGKAMYSVVEDIPPYRNPLKFIQDNWTGGHGQYDFKIPDMYFEGQSIDTTQEGKVILGPEITEVKESDTTDLDSAPTAFCWFPAQSKWMCATSGVVYQFDATNVYWAACNTSVNAVVDMKVFGTTLFAARGTTTNYAYTTNATDFTVVNLADPFANKFLVAPNTGGTAEVLWKVKQPNELSSNTSGITGGAAWSSPAYVGDTANNINNIFLANDNFMVGRTDGLWHYDSNGGIHSLMHDLRSSRSTDNFKYVSDWQTGVYFSLLRGMGEITSYSTYEPMGPLQSIDDIGKLGDVVGIASDKNWLYVAIDEGTNTIIYKCRERRVGDVLRWEYCPFVFLGTKTCAALAVCQHSSTDRRLWFGYTNTTGYVKLSDSPVADSTYYRYCANGWVRMSYDKGSNPYYDKLWQSIVTQTANCTVNNYVSPKYRKDTETTANALTANITTNATVMTNLTNALNCNRIQFQLDLKTISNTATPEVLYFEARGIEKPETVRIHECVYRVGDSGSIRAKTIRDFLRTGRTTKSLIKFADLRYGQKTSATSTGDYVWAIMQPGYPQEIEILHEDGRQPELGIKCRFQEVSFTIS